ncbi:MAG: glycosyltransferase family 39 protein [Anaerolineae bacterium]|nr:glycosyltransferase family 39 protein [Anaerolineae bacterium]
MSSTNARPRVDAFPVVLVFGLTVVSALLTAVPMAQWVRYSAAFALLWLLPAVAWYRWLPGEGLVRGTGGLGLAFVGSGLATLLLHLLPGAFPAGLARVVYVALVAVPLGLAARDVHDGEGAPEDRVRWDLVIVLAIALLVRLPNLGYSEFQGDEAVILQRAADALLGDDDQLFIHQKGPVEILVPMSVWALSGTITEWQARLPFVLAGLLAVLSVTALGSSWFGRRAGIAAGLLVAINGFLVAFARIVQYQNLVIVMGCLSLLWLIEYRLARRPMALVLSAIFLAFGLLSHYDTVLVAPAAVAVVVVALFEAKSDPRVGRNVFGALLVAAGVGAVVLALFYVPYVLNPMFSRTFNYLAGGRLGSGLLHNSLTSVWRMSTFYNALYYVVGLGALVLVAAMTRRGNTAAWLYLGVPLIFYCFVVIDPRTHVYAFYPGAAVLAGAALAGATQSASWTRPLRAVTGSALGLWYILCAGYIGLAFVGHRVEYKRAWPESRHPLYPVPFADEALPLYGHFGFPYQAGWKAVEYLFDQGIVFGTYASNEEPEVTTWYIRSGARTMCGHPDVYVVAEDVQDEIAIDWEELEREHSLIAEVTVRGTTKIRVFAQGRPDADVMRLSSEDYAPWYNRAATPLAQRAAPYGGVYGVGADFGDVGRLLGFDLAQSRVRRGSNAVVTLYWQALSSPDRNYQVYVHLVDDGELVAQHDGAPACAFAPTSLWESGEIVRDEHVIALDVAAPLGPYDLYIGLYDLLTFERLPVDGGPSDTLLLTRLEVLP